MRRLKSGSTPNRKGNDLRITRTAAELQDRLIEQSTYKLNQEVDTGETWIDGRAIYRMVTEVGPLPNATTKDVNHNVESYAAIIRIWGWAQDGDTTLPLPHPNPTAANSVAIALLNGQRIRIITGINRTGYTTAYIVLEYTK